MSAEAVDLRDVAIFVRVLETGSFTAAAAALRLPKSTISRRVTRLEGALGVRLLQRTTRSLAVTDAGQALLARVAPALAEVDEALGEASETRQVPRGIVRFTAPPDVGTEVLPELLTRFRRAYPEVEIEVDLAAIAPDLVTGRYDLALRTGPLDDGDVAVHKLQDTAFRLYAAPSYVRDHGLPERPEGLADHAAVLFRPREGVSRVRLLSRHGDVDVTLRGPVSANDLSFVRRAAIAGAGIALLPDLVGAGEVQAGRLVVVLPAYHARGLPLHLVHPSTRYVPLRVRALRDFLLEHFPV